MPVLKLYQWIKVTCLSDPGFSIINEGIALLRGLVQFSFVVWWVALFMAYRGDTISSVLILVCAFSALNAFLSYRFLAGMARQTFNLIVGLSTLILINSFPNAMAKGISYASEHIGSIVVMSLIVCFIIALQTLFSFFEDDFGSHSPMARPRSAPFIGHFTKLQSLDSNFVAAHETGHAIVLALFPHRPDGIEVVMTADVMGNTNNGWCSGVGLDTHCKPRHFLELEMICLLAGREAEWVFLGEYSVCGTSDNDKWLVAARRYLETSPTVIFFRKPASKQEFDYNAEQLEKLKAEHVDIARCLLLANQPVFEKVRDGMLEKGRVHGKELLDLLSQVKNVEGCPVLSARVEQALKDDLASRPSVSA